jgi:hypothetical protein
MPKKEPELRGVLTREIYVRMLNISGTGCLIESRRRLEIGTFAKLRLQLGSKEYDDDIQVVRCQAIEGAGALYHLGIQFLWTTPLHPGSIRQVVLRYVEVIKASPTPLRLM